MKNTALLLLLIICCGCQLLGPADSPDIDPNLIGEWYQESSSTSALPSPEFEYHGWSISSDGTMTPVGLEDSTGKIALIETRYAADIQNAKNGEMLVRHFDHPELIESTVDYEAGPDILIFHNGFAKGTYIKTKAGTVIRPPKPSLVRFTLDDSETENLRVSRQIPTAFISKVSDSRLRLRSNMHRQNLTIIIDDFDGPGTYIIGKNQAAFSRSGTDWLQPPYITQSDTSGTITIEFDAAANRFTGHFEFIADMDGAHEDDGFTVHLTDGTFDVPVLE